MSRWKSRLFVLFIHNEILIIEFILWTSDLLFVYYKHNETSIYSIRLIFEFLQRLINWQYMLLSSYLIYEDAHLILLDHFWMPASK